MKVGDRVRVTSEDRIGTIRSTFEHEGQTRYAVMYDDRPPKSAPLGTPDDGDAGGIICSARVLEPVG